MAPYIKTAARLGKTFQVDPISLMECDETTWLIRIACGQVIEEDYERQREELEKRK